MIVCLVRGVSAAGFHFDADCGAVRESEGFADAQFDPVHFRKVFQQALDNHVAQCLDQMNMCTRTFLDNRFTQFPVVQHAADIVVVDFVIDMHVDICVDMQGLGGTQFVLQNANAGVQREPGEKDAACGHGESVKEAGKARFLFRMLL